MSGRAAAIDCGTNSIRLLIAEVDPASGGLRDVVRTMRIVRLGEGVDATGSFSSVALERTLGACAEFREILAEAGNPPVRFIATSAMRDAQNRGELTERIRDLLGVGVEVISGEEEGRLSFLGATGALGTCAPPVVVIDIGGGSTEFVRGVVQADQRASVDIGCVRLTERYLRRDPAMQAQIAAATRAIDAGIAQASESVDLRAIGTLVGVAGSVTTVAAIAHGLPRYDPARIHGSTVSSCDVEGIAEDLLAMSSAERSKMRVMLPGRADVIAAGALILSRIVVATGVPSVLVSEHDILDGIVAELVPSAIG
jgi:exopolyphosphatase / guanosine-5'-triphosphate,3'-diphosphate pyrophosphatase